MLAKQVKQERVQLLKKAKSDSCFKRKLVAFKGGDFTPYLDISSQSSNIGLGKKTGGQALLEEEESKEPRAEQVNNLFSNAQ